MAKQEKPLTPKTARGKLSRYKKALQKTTEKRAAAFATAARKAALADVEDAKAAALRAAKRISAEYAKATKTIARVRLDAFKAKLKRNLAAARVTGEKDFLMSSTAISPDIEKSEKRQTDGQIATLRADAIRALSQDASKRMLLLLEDDLVTHFGPNDMAKTKHSDRVHNRVKKDDGDEHADDGLDD